MRTRLVLLLVLTGLTLAASQSPAAQPAGRRVKKLVATGWDRPDSAALRANLAEMEQRPFDGVFLEVAGKREDGRPCALRAAFTTEAWLRAWFQGAVDDLKATRPTRFTDNFVTIGANPGNVDWFDDEGWRQIVEHWRIAAWIAREGGLRGILFDPEPYTEPHLQFGYQAQPRHAEHTFAQYREKARQRGREIIEAVTGEYPEITLFCYFMNSVNAHVVGQGDPQAALRASGYGLYPAMIDGWLDRLPPGVTLVDGCESAYRYNSRQEFLEAAVKIKGNCQELVSPENRAKYRAQVQVSFGIYLDAYWNPPESPWHIDGLGGSRVERLRANVSDALEIADEYVWIYGEKFRWWPAQNSRVKGENWPDALPGSEQALALARDPVAYARTVLAQARAAGSVKNLTANAQFDLETVQLPSGHTATHREDGPPAGWSTWQQEGSHGVFAWDRQQGSEGPGSARAAGVAGGCFLQAIPVEPGELYLVRGMRRVRGEGNAPIRVRWQNAEERWVAEHQDVILTTSGVNDAWGELIGVVQVPVEARRLLVLLGVDGQTGPKDQAWYDDVICHKLTVAPSAP